MKWKNFLTRPGTPLKLDWSSYALEQNIYGNSPNMDNFLAVKKKGMDKTPFYLPEIDLGRFKKVIKENNFKNTDSMKKYVEECEKATKRFPEVAKNINNKDLSSKSISDLHNLFLEYHDAISHLFDFLFSFNVFEKILAKRLKKNLKMKLESRGEKNLFEEYHKIIKTKTKLNIEDKRERRILEIASKMKKKNGKIDDEIESEIGKLTEEQKWVPVYDFDLNPWGKDHFMELLKKAPEEPSKELNDRKEQMNKKREKLKNLKEKFESDTEFLSLIEIVQESLFLRGQRTDMYRKGTYYFLPFLEELGNRWERSRKELSHLTLGEFFDFFSENKIPSREETKRRIKHYLLLKKRGNVNIFSTSEKIQSVMSRELPQEEKKVKKLEGKGVYSGIASGKAKIVESDKSTDKLNEGDVLVASMTTPDIHSAIERASAIVTNEGGITSHAAIVSRELEIPCIIGTGNATRMLDDGDKVKVDSKEGVVEVVE